MTYEQHFIELRKMIIKDFGKQCPQFDINCTVCKKWLMLDILGDTMNEMEDKEGVGLLFAGQGDFQGI